MPCGGCPCLLRIWLEVWGACWCVSALPQELLLGAIPSDFGIQYIYLKNSTHTLSIRWQYVPIRQVLIIPSSFPRQYSVPVAFKFHIPTFKSSQWARFAPSLLRPSGHLLAPGTEDHGARPGTPHDPLGLEVEGRHGRRTAPTAPWAPAPQRRGGA